MLTKIYTTLFILLYLGLNAQNIDSLSAISGSESDYQLKLGEYYLKYDFLSEALEHCKTGLKVHKSKNDSIHIKLVNTIGQVYLRNHQYDKASLQFRKSIELSLNLDNEKLLAESKSDLGAVLEKKGLLDKALKYEIESNQIYNQIKDSIGIAKTLENIGSIYEDKNDFLQAQDYFLKARSYVQDTLSSEYINILNNIGDTFLKIKEAKQAMIYYTKAVNIAEKTKHLEQLESAHKDLSKAYALMNNHKKAYQEMVLYIDTKEKVLEKNNAIKISSIQSRYELQQKDAEINLLRAEKNITLTRQKLFITIALALLLGLVAAFLWFNKKRKENARLLQYEQDTLQIKLAKKEAEERDLNNKIKLKQFEKEALKNELDKKAVEESALQNEIKIKTASLSNYSLHISHKNKILLDLSESLKRINDRKDVDATKKIKTLIKEIESHLGEENEWEEFVQLFNEIHPNFMAKISSLTSDKLSPAELRLAILLRLNMSSKEIASFLRITPDSVRVARYRLRKKLPIEQGQDLVKFFIDL